MATYAGRYSKPLQDRYGNGYRNALVAVQTLAAAPVTLYADRDKTAYVPASGLAANEIKADSRGNLIFFADPGNYQIVVTPVGGFTLAAFPVSVLPDPLEPDASEGALQAEEDARIAGDALKLDKAANLGDVASAATSRDNLGLGDAATQDAADLPVSTAQAAADALRGGRTPSFRALRMALQAADESIAVGLLGDSTGDATDEWFYQVGEQLATAYPAYTVHFRPWNGTLQEYSRPTVIQTGPSGQRGVLMGSSSPRGLDWPAAAPPTGDIDIAMWCKPTTWTPGALQTFISFYGGSAGALAILFRLQTDGKLQFAWSVNGSNLVTPAVSTLAVPFANGTAGWVRAQLDVDNGSTQHTIKFFTSTDGATWTQLGTTETRAGLTSVFAATYRWEIGYRSGSLDPMTSGRLYEVEIRDGIDGPCLTPRIAEVWNLATVNPPTFEGSPVLTLVGGSWPSVDITYHTEATRIKRLNADFGQIVNLFSSSHNESIKSGQIWITALSGWITAVNALLPLASPVILTQNPRKSPAADIVVHGRRRRLSATWAAANGRDLIDTYGAFLAYPGGWEPLVSAADGVHPTTGSTPGTGSRLWADTVIAEINVA